MQLPRSQEFANEHLAYWQDNCRRCQDALFTREFSQDISFDVVFDGVGSARGDLAAGMLAQRLQLYNLPADRLGVELHRMVQTAHKLFRANGCATTILAASRIGNNFRIYNSGDGLAYFLTRSGLSATNEDRNAKGHLTNCVGGHSFCRLNRYEFPFEPGARLALLTDGVSDNVAEETVISSLRQPTPAQALQHLRDALTENKQSFGHLPADHAMAWKNDDMTALIRYF